MFITVSDKAAATQLATRFHDLGFEIIATKGTAQAISRMGIPVRAINKIVEGSPVVDFIRNREVDLVINTPTGSGARSDGYEIRNAAVRNGIPCLTTMTGASAAARDLRSARAWGGAAVPPGAPWNRPLTDRGASLVDHPGRALRAADVVLAPFGRRRCEVVANEASGGYRVVSAMDTSGRRAPASSTCWPRTAGAARTGGPTSRARSPSPRRRRVPRGWLDFLLEAVGPGTRAPEALPLGAGLHVTGPLGRPFSSGPFAGGRGAILVGGGIGVATLALLQRELSERGIPQRVLLGFRDRAHAGGLDLAARRWTASEDGHTGHQGYVTDLLAVLLEGDDAGSAVVYACGPPAMLEAVRDLCAARRCPRSSRSRRRWPAASVLPRLRRAAP